jgi:allantoinase
MSHPLGGSVRARAPYQSIVNRPALALPGGARVVIWNIVNVEVWEPTSAMPRAVLSPPMGSPLQPDIPNWSWHEYGMRVGFWRILEALSDRKMKATFALNGATCRMYEEVCTAALHAIRETMEEIRKFTGKPPRGWESPGLTETDDTLDHLAECGIEYVADWVLDDQPVSLNSPKGAITSIPYPVEINDVVISAVQQHSSDEILKRGKAQFDRLYRDGARSPRVMAISVHPYLSGVPHRIGYLEQLYDYVLGHDDVLVWTGEQILDWFLAQRAAAA